MAGYVSAAVIVAGLLGSIAVGAFLDRTKWFIGTQRALAIVAIGASLMVRWHYKFSANHSSRLYSSVCPELATRQLLSNHARGQFARCAE